MFPQLPERVDYPALERDVLSFWKEHGTFKRSIESRPASNRWVFNEGPPTVNGNPGIHHVFGRTLKDMFCRYKTMRGYRVERKGGWDTHGLPVEIAIEKQLGLKEKSEIETKVGVAEFNRLAREMVYEHINKPDGWNSLTEQMGYWVDLENPYITCTNDYVESVWWALHQFHEKGLIYRGFKIVPQCPHCETPLSSHELAQGYKDVRDPSLYVKARIVEESLPESLQGNGGNTFFLVWTTTPWTLISNVALAVGADINYVLVRNPATDEQFILAEARRATLDPDGLWEVLATVRGADLERVRYERLFSYVAANKDAWYVVTGNFVSTEDGTGIVHIAPAFGQDDYEVSLKHDLPVLQPVTGNGRFTAEVTDFAGRSVKTITFEDRTEEGVDKEIIIALKHRGLVLKSSNDYLHSYPHCWRCDNPLIYYARDSWFIRTTQYAGQMIEQNNTIGWHPPEIGAGRFGNWLEENKDWSLSRDRYWGTPLPIWVNESDPNDIFAVGSVAELMTGEFQHPDGSIVPMSDVAGQLDLHKPFVDGVIFRRDGKTYRRTPELIDVWFDSGSMPFAQWHYPFENREMIDGGERFPADFIAEGIDQTRGWFYTLHAISTALFGRTSQKNILVNDLILDKDGRKMSKRLGNVVDPFQMMNRYGADAVRWYLTTSAPPWKPRPFNPDDIARTVLSDFFRALAETYKFFVLYANIDGFTHTEEAIPLAERAELDRWILSVLASTTEAYVSLMDDYEPTKAMRLVSEFTIVHLSNWYVRRNRRRFWKGEMSPDKRAAYQTLYECLVQVCKLMAPAAPFFSDHLFRSLNGTTNREEASSVHLALISTADAATIDRDLERRMARAQGAVALARMLREKSGIKVRQPLRRLLIAVADETERDDYRRVEGIIMDELNVKGIEYVRAGQSDVVKIRAKGNFKALGPKFGKRVKEVVGLINGLTQSQIIQLQSEGKLLLGSNDPVEIAPEDIEIIHEDIEGWLVASEGPITVALDTELDAALRQEGLAREFVNRVQNLRKDSGLEVSDRIRLSFATGHDELRQALELQREYIMAETLAVELQQVEFRQSDVSQAADEGSQTEINGQSCLISLERSESVQAA
ncbi:MAG: isoleucine--tRNA ligase [Chlorobi bacterium]|nr:MAG: isoleucyl-tRNA synthetase [Chlorobi bacterium OLB7]MBK8912208.1 isoleucine--tRNA ligase [Chlorobiota bacterium]MBX7215926.1 isoleucine--tRNA ligase [Candidatus Kapabacteria bacterium]